MMKINGSDIRKKIIIVDGENCYGSKLHSKLIRISNADIVVVIGKGQHIKDYNRTKVKIVEAQSGEKNALDFVIVSVAIDELVRKNYKQAIIVSDDKGYDAAIDYLRLQGHNIRRQKSNLKYSRVYLNDNKDIEFKSLCGFIANNLQSGMREDKVADIVFGRTNMNYFDYVNLLMKFKYITKSKRKIYFEKSELSAIAKNKIQIGERLK